MIPFDLAEPTSLSAAIKLLNPDDPTIRPIAGGTALMLMMKAGVFNPETFIAEGWIIESDRENLPADWNPNMVKTISSLRKGENSIPGEESIKRVAQERILGVRAFHHFWNNQADIPEEWKKYYVFFDATVLRGPNGNHCSLYLDWYGSRWRWSYDWLGYERDSCYVSALSAS